MEETMSILPTKKTPIKADLADQTVLLYGAPKVGKSSTCAQAPGALFLATEPGLNHLEVFQVPITNWEEFLDAAAEVAKGGHSFKTIIIDTCDNAYRYCTAYVCAKHGVKHPTDLAYGKGFALVNAEFHRVLTKLAALPYGLFLVSHAQEKEIEGRTGKYVLATPTLPDTARKIILGMVDMILYADLENETTTDGKTAVLRVMRTKPDKHYEAGDRTGRLPAVLPLDYAAFAEAFSGKRAEAAKTQKPTA
jgi:hypothetical protein